MGTARWTFIIQLVVAFESLYAAFLRHVTPNKLVFQPRHSTKHFFAKTTTIIESDDDTNNNGSILPLLKLASAHCASQALYTAVKLGIPDIINRNNGTAAVSLEDISTAVGATTSTNALLRTLRLLTTVDILAQEDIVQQGATTVAFSLTPTGSLLLRSEQQPSMASCILHWMERPLWNAWLELPHYIQRGVDLPFDKANGGISSDDYYNAKDHPESLQHANDFVRLIHQHEVQAVVRGGSHYWTRLSQTKSRLVDIGGNRGQVVGAIAQAYPDIDCVCLDLPHVIEHAGIPPPGVTLVAGNVWDASSIPPCDCILLKHFLDRCSWKEEESVAILQSCGQALRRKTGKIILAEAVLPNIGRVNESNQVSLYMDALYMLVGREGQRTENEWNQLASQAGFQVEQIIPTQVPSCHLIVLGRIVPAGKQ